MSHASGWKDSERWLRMKDGTECPMCVDVDLAENQHSFMVSELYYSLVRLPRNQYMRGWTVVILKRHACELFELSAAELAGFWGDVAVVASALTSIYRPAKINYGVFGNLCPHMHCHVLVQSFDDDPMRPIDMNEREVLLSKSEYVRMVADLQDAISRLHNSRMEPRPLASRQVAAHSQRR